MAKVKKAADISLLPTFSTQLEQFYDLPEEKQKLWIDYAESWVKEDYARSKFVNNLGASRHNCIVNLAAGFLAEHRRKIREHEESITALEGIDEI